MQDIDKCGEVNRERIAIGLLLDGFHSHLTGANFRF